MWNKPHSGVPALAAEGGSQKDVWGGELGDTLQNVDAVGGKLGFSWNLDDKTRLFPLPNSDAGGLKIYQPSRPSPFAAWDNNTDAVSSRRTGNRKLVAPPFDSWYNAKNHRKAGPVTRRGCQSSVSDAPVNRVVTPGLLRLADGCRHCHQIDVARPRFWAQAWPPSRHFVWQHWRRMPRPQSDRNLTARPQNLHAAK